MKYKIIFGSIVIIACMIIISIIGFIGFAILNNFKHAHNQKFTVTDKQAVHNGGTSQLLVFTDVTTYTVDDSILNWRFDSADVYGKLKVGSTYTATLQGNRVPFLSWYPNIISPVEVTAVE